MLLPRSHETNRFRLATSLHLHVAFKLIGSRGVEMRGRTVKAPIDARFMDFASV
jgi:hypothetical protein